MSKDIDELIALNKDYVDSVQRSDVKRFDEILAADFYCSNPDKSLVDRAAFLKQTARPVAIRNLRAHDVKIRVLGDFAIIHAATNYTTADGQETYGRYTDCRAASGSRSLRMCRGKQGMERCCRREAGARSAGGPSGHRPNQHSFGAILWATRWLLLLWLPRRYLLRSVTVRSRLGLHTQSAPGLWQTLSCYANGRRYARLRG